MAISRFFRELRTGYQSEIDDLISDSEGKNVLKKRLAEKHSQSLPLRRNDAIYLFPCCEIRNN